MARYKAGSKPTDPSLQVQNRRRIQKMLSSDREAIRLARAYAATRVDFNLLDEPEQKRRLTEVAKNRIQGRIDGGLHVSCHYQEFIGYLPPSFYGQTGHVADPEKDERLNRQLEALRQEPASDDDMPPFKQERSDAPSQVEQRKSGLFATHKDDKHSNGSARPTTTSQQSHLKHASTPSLERKRANNSKGDDSDDEDEAITWRAVSRGQHYLPGSPAANFEQRKPKINPWLGREVFRGQIVAEGSKDESQILDQWVGGALESAGDMG